MESEDSESEEIAQGKGQLVQVGGAGKWPGGGIKAHMVKNKRDMSGALTDEQVLWCTPRSSNDPAVTDRGTLLLGVLDIGLAG